MAAVRELREGTYLKRSRYCTWDRGSLALGDAVLYRGQEPVGESRT
jgi:hypothetical protein